MSRAAELAQALRAPRTCHPCTHAHRALNALPRVVWLCAAKGMAQAGARCGRFEREPGSDDGGEQ